MNLIDPDCLTLRFLFRFQLHYYSNFPMKEREETILTVDSRSKNINNNYADDLDDQENELADPLENAIQTKFVPEILDHALTRHCRWSWAAVDWNGMQPYV